MELTSTQGPYDVALHMKIQVAEMSGRNEELRRELDTSRGEAKQVREQLNSALEKVWLHNNTSPIVTCAASRMCMCL